MRLFGLLLILAPLALAKPAGLEMPLKSPVARRLRIEAKATCDKARAVFDAVRKDPAPTDAEVRQAFADVGAAIGKFERAQRTEWDFATNTAEQKCVRLWVDLRKVVKPVPAPTDPEAKAKWEKKQDKARRDTARDARRFLTKVLGTRRHAKLFGRCSRCDGRGDLRSAFGDSSVCPNCKGKKHTANRRGILAAHWYSLSPFFRASGRERSKMNFVLQSGVGGEDRIAPFTKSVVVQGKVEDHGWWFRIRTKEKVLATGESKKATEREGDYLVVNLGRTWWLADRRSDRDLQLPQEE
jgi:hypothetical protein